MAKRLYFETMKRPATTINIDNTAALWLSLSDQVSAKRKHLSVKYHYVRELIRMKQLELTYLPSKDQLTDILAKVFDYSTFKHLSAFILD